MYLSLNYNPGLILFLMQTSDIKLATGMILADTRRCEDPSPQRVLVDLRDEAQRLVEAGFEGVELPSPFLSPLRKKIDAGFWQDVIQTLNGVGVELVSVHGPNLPSLEVPLVQAVDEAVWHAVAARELGAPAVVIHPTPHSHPHVCSVLPKLLERDKAVAQAVHQVLQGSKTQLAIENLPTYGIAYLEALMDQIPEDSVGVCFDTGHWNVRPERSLISILERLGPRLVHLHLTDNNGLCDQHLAPGGGTFPWCEFLGLLSSAMKNRTWLIELSGPDPATADHYEQAVIEASQVMREAALLARSTLNEAFSALSQGH